MSCLTCVHVHKEPVPIDHYCRHPEVWPLGTLGRWVGQSPLLFGVPPEWCPLTPEDPESTEEK